MSLKILYKVTSRSRPEWCKRAIQSIIDNEADDNRLILVSLDSDDPTMTTPDIMEWMSEHGCHMVFGTSKNKIHAINRDIDKVSDFYNWDILVNVSDDQVFTMKGFDDVIRKQYKQEFSKGVAHAFGHKDAHVTGGFFLDLDLVAHFPDGNRKDLMTMSIIGRDYYNRDKYIYHSDYITECCDDEAQEVAKIRGCYKFVDIQIFDHLHVAYGKAENDLNYQLNLQHGKRMQDRETLYRRRAINFGL